MLLGFLSVMVYEQMLDIRDFHGLYVREDPDLVRNSDILLGPRGAVSLVVSVCLTALATCFVVARIYTRKYIVGHVEPNDWMIIIALVSI